MALFPRTSDNRSSRHRVLSTALHCGRIAVLIAFVTACTTGAPATERASVHELEQARLNALAQSDPDALAQVESGTALQVDTAYFLELCPGLCPDPPTDPMVQSVRVLADNGEQFVGVVADDWYPAEAVGPTLTHVIGDPARIVYQSMLTLDEADRIADDHWSLAEFEARDLDALAQYGAFLAEVTNTGELPPSHPFKPGQLTTGYLESLSTHQDLGPEFLTHTAFSLDEKATMNDGFVLENAQGERLSCGVLRDVETLRAADGSPIDRTALGNQQFRAPDGLVPGYRVTTVRQSCVLTGQSSIIVPALAQATTMVEVTDGQSSS